jgi:hypothetical protein
MCNTVTRRPVSRQRPKYAHATIEKILQKVFFYVVRIYSLLGNVCFFLGPPRVYIKSRVLNQRPVTEQEREWSESSAVKEKGSADD